MTAPPADSTRFLAGGGEMGARMRSFGWDATVLGPPAQWPQSLKTIVRVMLDSRYAMWMLWGPEFTFFCNDAYLPTVGNKRDWVLSARADRVWEEIWPEIGPRIDHVLRTGEATWDEELLLYLERRGFPEETYHTFSYGPVYGDDDRITGMLCVVTETTAQVIEARRMRMLSELAAQSARVQAVADLCSGFISVLDTHRHDIPFAELYLLDEASATSRRVGHTASAPLAGSEGLWPLEAVTRSAQPELVCNLAAILGVGPASPWPERVDRALVLPLKTVGHSLPAGFLIAGLSTRAPFDARYRSFLELAAGQISAALADAAAHAAERQRAEALAQIDRAKTVFFSNVSHELRTPLTLILGPAEDLAGDPRLDGAMRECASLIHRNSLRLLKLVNSLLDFSRIEAGRMPSVFEPTDLAAFTRELASSFEAAMHAAGLRFVVEAEPELPPVHVDREHWEKIVLNLLSNAFKFTLTGQVRLALRQDRGEFLLELEDSGIGIPAAELPRLFERFHRVEGAQGRSVEGSGIGLALVHDLVQLHGGKIEVDSTPGVGSTFRIRLAFGTAHLPQQSTAIDAPTAHPGAMATAVAEESLRWLPRAPETVTAPLPALSASDPANRRFASTFGARIVVADDSADMRSHLRSALAPHYAIETVADAREALATLRRAPADLLLSDVMMPGIDGFALLRAVREDPVLGATPVILLSARAGEEARVEGLGAGADDYLIKPFSSRELLARVGATIELVRMRKDASDRERAIAARLEGALADGRVGTAIWNLETDRVEADGNFGRLLGIPPAELAEARIETVRSRLAPSNALRLDAALAEALALSDTVEIDDLEVTHPDGRMVWITARGRVRRNAEGVPIEVSGAVVDITERKQAEAALRASERRLRLAQRAAGTAAWELDIDAGKVFWTPEAYEFFGVSPADPDPIGTWRARVHPEDRSRSLSAFPEFVAHGASTEFEFRYRHPQRGDRRILSHGAVFEEGGRRVIAALSIDVTGRRLAEAEREQLLSAERAARAEAEAATRTKDEFLATLSHELRTPLSVIVSWSRILQQRFGSLDEQLAKGLGLIVKNGLAQSELISDLLDMSRIASGKINLDTGPLDLNDLIMEVVNSQRPAAEARGLGLYAHPIAQPALVLGDATRLQQVLWNLVTNALKFTPSGGEVNVRLARRQDRIDISVTDTGEGIAADFLPHLFGRFRQAEGGASRRHGGLGLGLAIVKQLVELHGGQAIAQSAGKGRGSSFTVRLPAFGIAAMDALEPTGTLPLANDMLESNLLAGLAVLAVEDQPDMLEYLRRVLEEQGARVVVATSGAQALDLLAAGAEAEDVDVLLTDISMPGMDGYEFIRKVRDALKVDAAALPAVALTAFARDEDRNRALSEGFQAHLSKPYHVAHLVSVINRLRRSDGVPGG